MLTKKITVVYKDNDGLPISLDGYTGKGQVRATAQSPEVLLPLIVDVRVPASGIVDISITGESTASIPVKGKSYADLNVFYYDVEMTTSGNTFRLLNGAFRVSPRITK